MRNKLQSELKKFLRGYIIKLRNDNNLTQKKMANLLEMDVRSYSDIENGKNMCSTLTFILLLSQLRNNGEELLNDLKDIIDDNYKNNNIK